MKKSWFYILLSLASSDRYGSAIQEDVRSMSDGEVRLWPATLYGALEELATQSWIRELDHDECPDDGKGRERFYRILPAGREALAGEVARIEGLASTARARLGTS